MNSWWYAWFSFHHWDNIVSWEMWNVSTIRCILYNPGKIWWIVLEGFCCLDHPGIMIRTNNIFHLVKWQWLAKLSLHHIWWPNPCCLLAKTQLFVMVWFLPQTKTKYVQFTYSEYLLIKVSLLQINPVSTAMNCLSLSSHHSNTITKRCC